MIDWDMLLHDEYNDVKSMLNDMYSKMTYSEIGEVLGVNQGTVRTKCQAFNIKTRKKGEQP